MEGKQCVASFLKTVCCPSWVCVCGVVRCLISNRKPFSTSWMCAFRFILSCSTQTWPHQCRIIGALAHSNAYSKSDGRKCQIFCWMHGRIGQKRCQRQSRRVLFFERVSTKWLLSVNTTVSHVMWHAVLCSVQANMDAARGHSNCALTNKYLFGFQIYCYLLFNLSIYIFYYDFVGVREQPDNQVWVWRRMWKGSTCMNNERKKNERCQNQYAGAAFRNCISRKWLLSQSVTLIPLRDVSI